MYIPVNPDRVMSGIHLVESFADLYGKDVVMEDRCFNKSFREAVQVCFV